MHGPDHLGAAERDAAWDRPSSTAHRAPIDMLSARKNTQATTTDRNVTTDRGDAAAGREARRDRGTEIIPGVVDAEIDAVQRAPHDERPGRAVPEPAEHHGDHQVDIAQDAAVAVAAERDVEIVAQELRQRHVPAPPEIDDAGGLVGRIEIERQEDAEHQRNADRHVGIAGEIEIELERIGQRADPGLVEASAYARRRRARPAAGCRRRGRSS